MKIALISLFSLAIVLGIVAYFAVFSGAQVIEPVEGSDVQQSSTPTLVLTAPSSSAFATDTILTMPATPAILATTSVITSIFSAPYPVTWQEGDAQLAVTGASLEDDQLTLSVNVQLGTSTQCVPIDLLMITDEEGDTSAPSVSASDNASLAQGGGCNVSASGQYASNATFTVDPTSTPFLFMTSEPSSTFFEVTTTTGNGLQVAVPEQSG